MSLIRPFVVASLSAAALIAVSTSNGLAALRNSAVAEHLRYNRAHDDSVVAELSASTPSTLGAAQHLRRSLLLSELHAYRDRGAFPHNYDFPGERVPYFVDPKTGALCAVANLLAFSGRRDIVDRVARTNNHVWVQQLAGDTAFRAWLSENGLTLADAARIQLPAASSNRPSGGQMAAVAGVAMTGIAIGGGMAISTIWNASANADGHRRDISALGFVSGTLVATGGAAIMLKSREHAVGALTLGAGALSTALAVHSIRSHTAIVAAAERERSKTQVSLAPVVSAEHGGAAGLSMSLRF